MIRQVNVGSYVFASFHHFERLQKLFVWPNKHVTIYAHFPYLAKVGETGWYAGKYYVVLIVYDVDGVWSRIVQEHEVVLSLCPTITDEQMDGNTISGTYNNLVPSPSSYSTVQ